MIALYWEIDILARADAYGLIAPSACLSTISKVRVAITKVFICTCSTEPASMAIDAVILQRSQTTTAAAKAQRVMNGAGVDRSPYT